MLVCVLACVHMVLICVCVCCVCMCVCVLACVHLVCMHATKRNVTTNSQAVPLSLTLVAKAGIHSDVAYILRAHSNSYLVLHAHRNTYCMHTETHIACTQKHILHAHRKCTQKVRIHTYCMHTETLSVWSHTDKRLLPTTKHTQMQLTQRAGPIHTRKSLSPPSPLPLH